MPPHRPSPVPLGGIGRLLRRGPRQLGFTTATNVERGPFYLIGRVVFRSQPTSSPNPLRHRLAAGPWDDGVPPLVGSASTDFVLAELQEFRDKTWRPRLAWTYPGGQVRLFILGAKPRDGRGASDETAYFDLLLLALRHEQLVHQMPRMLGYPHFLDDDNHSIISIVLDSPPGLRDH